MGKNATGFSHRLPTACFSHKVIYNILVTINVIFSHFNITLFFFFSKKKFHFFFRLDYSISMSKKKLKINPRLLMRQRPLVVKYWNCVHTANNPVAN